LNEDTKAKVKDFEKKLGECLDDSNFILQGEDGVDLKMLEDLDNERIVAMVEDRITLTEEEYDDMIIEEHPEANDEEAVD
jgi:predicted LPLAT superfamily acyltransferase